jgi:hypothetical protein
MTFFSVLTIFIFTLTKRISIEFNRLKIVEAMKMLVQIKKS